MKLLLDASGPTIHIGLLHQRQWVARCTSESPPLETLFSGVRQCLKQARVTLQEITGFVYCDGPGSTLGLRLTLMALKAWRALPQWATAPLYAYHRLHMAAALATAQGIAVKPFRLITEFRQGSWHCLKATTSSAISSAVLSTLSNDELKALTGTIFYLPQRKRATPLTIQARRLAYDLNHLPNLLGHSDIFRTTYVPKAFAVASAPYRTWKPERHR